MRFSSRGLDTHGKIMASEGPGSSVRWEGEDAHRRTPESQLPKAPEGAEDPPQSSSSLGQPLRLELPALFTLLLPSLFGRMCILIGRS